MEYNWEQTVLTSFVYFRLVCQLVEKLLRQLNLQGISAGWVMIPSTSMLERLLAFLWLTILYSLHTSSNWNIWRWTWTWPSFLYFFLLQYRRLKHGANQVKIMLFKVWFGWLIGGHSALVVISDYLLTDEWSYKKQTSLFICLAVLSLDSLLLDFSNRPCGIPVLGWRRMSNQKKLNIVPQ